MEKRITRVLSTLMAMGLALGAGSISAQKNSNDSPAVQANAPKDLFTVAAITPDVVRPGGRISIVVEFQVPVSFASEPAVRVLIAGEDATVGKVEFFGSYRCLITAIVPPNLETQKATVLVGLASGLVPYQGVLTVERAAAELLSGTAQAPSSQDPATDGGDPGSERLSWLGVVYFSLGIALGVALLALLRNRLQAARPAQINISTAPVPPAAVTAPIPLTPIDIHGAPAALSRAMSRRECVVVLGPGAGRENPRDHWNKMIREIAEGQRGGVYDTLISQILATGEADGTLEVLSSLMGREVLVSRISGALKANPPRRSTELAKLGRVPFAAALSLDIDGTDGFVWPQTEPLVHNAAERGLDLLSQGEFFVLRLKGCIDEPDTLLLSDQDLRDALARNAALRDLLKRLYYSRTMLFIGMDLGSIQTLLSMVERAATPSQNHVALVEVGEVTWEARALTLRSLYGVDVVPYTAEFRQDAVSRFLSTLETSGETRHNTRKIDRVELQNIGPFAECKVELDPSWTVLLGDNGVGKSTILRAIAVCLAGGAANEASAGRLVRSGQQTGSITLVMGEKKYVTTISRRPGGGCNVESPSGTPIEIEGVLAMGYSALRAVGGGVGDPPPARPAPIDLAPLTGDKPDTRIEGLKQWIARLDHLRSSQDTPNNERARYELLYSRVFELFSEVATGVSIKPGGVNPKTGEITIQSSDGPIPLESLSQGTLSLVGWTGLLMQRLYETAPQDVDPLQAPAIVLVDEIDAHMHPAWQQTLITRLSNIFKGTQFIVTSHSALLVGGCEPSQVYRFERNRNGGIDFAQPTFKLKGLGVGGLLTSGLFGLTSQLDPESAAALDRKRQLQAREAQNKISEIERTELKELSQELQDVDFSKHIRDPRYQQFVAAISSAEANERKQGAPPPITTTAEEREKTAQLADQIVQEIRSSPAPGKYRIEL